MADYYDDDRPPLPPVRNDSARTFNSFCHSSSSAGSISTSSTSTNNTSSSSNTSPILDKPLPKTPDEDDTKKPKSKLKLLLTKDKDEKTMVISSPTNFEHTLHVHLNPISGEFIGMPDEWRIALQNSTITINERIQNPQAVIDVLSYYHNYHQNNIKYMYSTDKYKSMTPPRNTCLINNSSNQTQTHLTTSSSESSSLHGESDEEYLLDRSNSTNYTNTNCINIKCLRDLLCT